LCRFAVKNKHLISLIYNRKQEEFKHVFWVVKAMDFKTKKYSKRVLRPTSYDCGSWPQMTEMAAFFKLDIFALDIFALDLPEAVRYFGLR
jgi:hypothetical protein